MIRLVVGLAAVGVAAWLLSGKTEELSGVRHYLDHLRWWWLIVAVGAELVSYGALSSLQRRMLRAGHVRLPAKDMFGITLAGSAIQYSFPGGSVIYLAYLFRQFRRWGADELLAGWVLIAFNLVTFVSLAVLSTIGLALALGQNTFDLIEVILGIVAVSALLTILVSERRRVVPHVARLVGLWQRLFRRSDPSRSAQDIVMGWADELGAVSPSRKVWVRSGVMGMANWLADLSCLALSFMAVGVGVPWRGLILAYAAGQLAATLPITPGGLGVAEGSLTIALEYYGGQSQATAAAVLLYRLVSFWMILPIGWASWAAVALAGRRNRDPLGATAATVESGVPGGQL